MDNGISIWLDGNTLHYSDYPAEPVRQALSRWFLKHNIDPDYVPIPGWVEIDYDKYQIRWLNFVPNIKTIPAEQIIAGLHLETRMLQLEARPFPFPSLDLSDYEPPGDDE